MLIALKYFCSYKISKMLIVLGIDNHFFYFMTVSTGLNSASLNVFQICEAQTLKCTVLKTVYIFFFKSCCTYDAVLCKILYICSQVNK